MEFVFWQNIISIHQKAFLEALVKEPGVGSVLLVVEHELTPVRRDMGWETPELKGVDVVLSPTEEKIESIVVAHKDAVHTMGGIRIGNMITQAFDACIGNNCRIGVMTEPYDDTGVKGALRKIKYRYYKTKYFRHVQFVLAIGKQAQSQYTELGYDAARLFPWAYFITLDQRTQNAVAAKKEAIRIIYAGRLEEAKGIYRFLCELADFSEKNFKLDIYGTGEDEEKIIELIAAKGLSDNVTLTRFLKYKELLEKYRDYDWVVLPSTQKDGWGVVISEGLLNGLRAICSKKCGVSEVIKEGVNGTTFDWGTAGSCNESIGRMLAGNGFASGEDIRTWANRAISGEAGARYFMAIMDNLNNNNEKPRLPWTM